MKIIAVKKIIASILILLTTAGIAAIRLSCNGMPHATPANAPKNEFSAERALVHVRTIARKPHCPGSEEHRRVKEYILSRLRETGWEVHVQKLQVAHTLFPGYHAVSLVENIAARRHGSGSGTAVLFMGHYDSVPTGPGASDNGAAVAAMLEAARALNMGPAPANDIILLFTDAEETGHNGAQAYIESHPWRKDTRLVVNLEARGVRGPSTLFETGHENGGVIPGYCAADPFANGNSLSNALYTVLPNDTDFTEFKEAGYPGLNFAYIGGITRYHTMLDTPENCDPRSLQHHGEHLVALARHFGNTGLDNLKKTDMVYFPVGGNIMARYSYTASHALAAVTGAAVIILLAAGCMKSRTSPLKVLGGCAAALAGIALSVSVILGLWKLVKLFVPGYHAMIMGEPYDAPLYRIAFTAISAAMALLVHRLSVKRLGLINYSASGLALWLIILVGAQVFITGAGFLFLWPLIFALPATAMLLFGTEKTAASTPVVLALSIPAFLMMTDLLYNLYEGLGLSLSPSAGLFIVLYLIIMAPLVEVLMRRGGMMLPATAAAIGVLFLAAGIAGAGFDRDNPRPDSLAYGLDADTGQARWISCDRDVDEFTGQFFAEGSARAAVPRFFPMVPRCILRPWTFLSARARAIGVEPPRVTVSSTAKRAGRAVTARIISPRGARGINVFIRRAPHLAEVRIFGRKLADKPFESLKLGHRMMMKEIDYRNWMIIACQAVPPEGIDLVLDISGKEPVEMRVVDMSDGLPDLSVMGYLRRSPRTMQSPDFLIRDSVMVVKKFFL